jgi:MOSC domain-containing protein YiiM
MGRIERIWIKSSRRGPMTEVSSAVLVAGHGLEGNVERRGRRQVTLLDRTAWDRAAATLGAEVDPTARRANLLLDGIDLEDSRDRVLRVGPCRIRIHGETKPCERMDEAQPGLRAALRPRWAAGAYGAVLDDGVIRVGDPVRWDDGPGEAASS